MSNFCEKNHDLFGNKTQALYLCIRFIIVMNTIWIGGKYMNTYERLIEYSIKPSMQRLAIMEYLMEHPVHPSADDIYTALAPTMPTLSKTTVYNTLKLFSELGAAQMLTIDDRNTNFDADTTPHAHFLCKRCGRIYDMKLLEAVKKVVDLDMEGHQVSEVHYYYKGLCKNCLNEQ